MFDRYGKVLTTAVVLAVFAVGVAADTLDEVEKKIAAACKKLESYSANYTYAMEMNEPSYKSSGHGEGHHEFMRSGGKSLWRSEMKMTQEMTFGDQAQKMESTLLTICDGQYAYTLTEQSGMKTAVKTKLDPAQQGIMDENMFASLRKDHKLELLPDEKVNGADVYVIKATPKDPAAQAGPATYYISKEHGLMLKMVMTTKAGKPMITIMYKDVKTNVKLGADRFVFKAPAGVQVMDMTNQ